jgi:hypothetical protein
MASKTDLTTAQEAFYSALKRSQETVADLRLARTGRRGGTGEMAAVEPSPAMMGRSAFVGEVPQPPRRPRRTPSQLRISAEGMSSNDFRATMLLAKRLRWLGAENETAEIVCLDEGLRFRNGNARFTCKGLQSFWTRAGNEPPPVRYTSESLEQVLDSKPVAVFMDPDKAPAGVRGYIKVVLDEPHVCMLLREE